MTAHQDVISPLDVLRKIPGLALKAPRMVQGLLMANSTDNSKPMGLGWAFEKATRENPHGKALFYRDVSYTYAQFNQWANRIAHFFLAQGLFAAGSLEVINYIEHYGLERRRGPDGRYERTTHLHSWNSDYALSNWLLFQLQRHSDHHAFPKRRYAILRHHADSPQLPGGYAAMFVLALVPPLWRRVVDPRVRAYYAGEEHQLTDSQLTHS